MRSPSSAASTSRSAGGTPASIRLDHPLRRDPDGKPYPPFHDVQCMVEGPAAAALGEIATARWTAAGCISEAFLPVEGDHWPASVPAPAQAITAGIARTEPRTETREEIDEVARLFEASINAANRFIYIENQFTSANEIARALARRMVDVPALRVLIVTPKAHSSWFESQAMQGGRGGFPRSVHCRRRYRSSSYPLSVGRRREIILGGDGAQQGHDRRRRLSPRRLRQHQQPLHGGGYRMRRGVRGDHRASP